MRSLTANKNQKNSNPRLKFFIDRRLAIREHLPCWLVSCSFSVLQHWAQKLYSQNKWAICMIALDIITLTLVSHLYGNHLIVVYCLSSQWTHKPQLPSIDHTPQIFPRKRRQKSQPSKPRVGPKKTQEWECVWISMAMAIGLASKGGLFT